MRILPLRAGRLREKYLWVVPLLFALAIGLTVVMPGEAAPRDPFQSSLIATGTATRSPTPARTVQSPLGTSTPTASPQPSVTPARPLPSPTPAVLPAKARTATAVALSFLSAPTLSVPGAAPRGAAVNDPLAITSRAADPVVPPAAPASSEGSAFAPLLDTGMRVASYAWLVCAAVEIAAAAAGIAWYLRRRTWKRDA